MSYRYAELIRKFQGKLSMRDWEEIDAVLYDYETLDRIREIVKECGLESKSFDGMPVTDVGWARVSYAIESFGQRLVHEFSTEDVRRIGIISPSWPSGFERCIYREYRIFGQIAISVVVFAAIQGNDFVLHVSFPERLSVISGEIRVKPGSDSAEQ